MNSSYGIRTHAHQADVLWNTIQDAAILERRTALTACFDWESNTVLLCIDARLLDDLTQ